MLSSSYFLFFVFVFVFVFVFIWLFKFFFSFSYYFFIEFINNFYIFILLCLIFLFIFYLFFIYFIFSFNDIFIFLNIFFTEYGYFNFFLFFNFFNISCFYMMIPCIFLFCFVSIFSLLYCFMYNFSELFFFIFSILFIFLCVILFFLVDSIFFFFILYELTGLPAFFILYKFSKNYRSVEAAYIMFLWMQVGALFLFFSFIYLFIYDIFLFSEFYEISISFFDVYFIFFCWFFGFGVKMPIWPFYSWLPRAHVEASTNFSIFLSGVLIKIAFFGFLRCFECLLYNFGFSFILLFLFFGIFDVASKLFYQLDLKKIVALTTVLEMHWLLCALFLDSFYISYVIFTLLISHALLSTLAFFFVDSVSRRFYTRLINEISGIFLVMPTLYFYIYIYLIIFLGFPFSLFFFAEIFFFIIILDFFPILGLFFFLVIYYILGISTFYLWSRVLFGHVFGLCLKNCFDIELFEFLLYFILFSLLFILLYF